MIKHILIIADEKSPQLALKRGLELSDLISAKVTVLAYCHESITLVEPKRQQLAIKSITDAKKKLLTAEIDAAKSQQQKVKLEVIWEKHIAANICEYVKNHGVDLVIKSGQRSETLLHTPTDWQLFREAACSVMILSQQKWRKTKPILAAVDLKTRKKSKQELNHKILLQASQISNQLNCDLHVVDVIHIPTLLKDFDLVDPKSETAKAKKSLKPIVSQLSKQYNIPIENFHIKQGQVEKVIASTAGKLKADLLVLGTVGRKGLKAKMLGNTAEAVLSTIHTDVCTVRL